MEDMATDSLQSRAWMNQYLTIIAVRDEAKDYHLSDGRISN